MKRIEVFRKLYVAILMACLSLSVTFTYAQDRLSFQPVAGMGMSYVLKKNTETRYLPKAFPHAGVIVVIPVGSDLSIRTGAVYQQKGWFARRAESLAADEMDLQFKSEVRLHEIATPMQLYYKTKPAGDWQFSLSAGVSYEFLFRADRADEVDVYYRGNYSHTEDVPVKSKVGLFPDNSRLKKADGTTYYLFNAAGRVDAGMWWKDKYMLQLFWEQGINNLSAADGDPTIIRVGYCGISLGLAIK